MYTSSATIFCPSCLILLRCCVAKWVTCSVCWTLSWPPHWRATLQEPIVSVHTCLSCVLSLSVHSGKQRCNNPFSPQSTLAWAVCWTLGSLWRRPLSVLFYFSPQDSHGQAVSASLESNVATQSTLTWAIDLLSNMSLSLTKKNVPFELASR